MASFSSVVGHRRLIALLSQAVERGTLPPTLLFAGPVGVGKFHVARAVAAALNCGSPVLHANGRALDACGVCRACDRIERGLHVDVHVLKPDERASIKTDVVRDVLQHTGFRPFEGRRRVVIIRDADALEDQAQNALLKSLEEPPPATGFILTTALPGVLLPTVRSRSMPMRFAALSQDEIVQVLTRDYGMDEEAARASAVLANGSVAQALAVASDDLELLSKLALSLLRQAAASPAVPSRLHAAGGLALGAGKKERSRDELALVLRMAASMLRDIELLNAGADSRSLANAGLEKDLRSLTRAFSGSRAREAFVSVDRALVALERNAGIKVVAEWLATQI